MFFCDELKLGLCHNFGAADVKGANVLTYDESNVTSSRRFQILGGWDWDWD